MATKNLKELALDSESAEIIEDKYNEIRSFSKKLTKFIINMDTTTLLVSLISIGLIAILIGSMKESIINAEIIKRILKIQIVTIIQYLQISP